MLNANECQVNVTALIYDVAKNPAVPPLKGSAHFTFTIDSDLIINAEKLVVGVIKDYLFWEVSDANETFIYHTHEVVLIQEATKFTERFDEMLENALDEFSKEEWGE